jgi:DNA-binding CsgD family transcriptional regulator
MAIASPERLRDDLVRLVHRGAGVREFSLAAGRILTRAVPFDGVCVVTMDPATLLPTGEVVDGGLPTAATARMAEIEAGGEDFNAFAALACSGPPAAALSEATHGELDRSLRHHELRAPNGFGDELRAVLADDGATWGGLTLLRGDDHRSFTPTETALVASITRYIAEGLRRSVVLTDRPAERDDREQAAGLVLLGRDNSVTLADAAAQRWLAELRGDGAQASIPPPVSAVASRARRIADGRAPADGIARARVRTATGEWLVVRASTLGAGTDAQTAVILEPARPHELAPLVADAYELTPRERAVTQLVARGLPTNAIGQRLHVSPWTVQDHLKSIFEKVGVTTRGELVARLFFAHRAPRLTDSEGGA